MSMGPAMLSKSTRACVLPAYIDSICVCVVLRDDLALDVELQRQLALRLREVLRQQREVLDRLPVAEVRVDAVDRLLHVRAAAPASSRPCLLGRVPVRARSAPSRKAGPRRSTTARSISGSRIRPNSSGCGAMYLPPAVLKSDFLRSVILQEAVGVDLADVAGVDPAVLQRLGGRLGVLVVAEHVARALDQDLAVVGDLQLDARERLAHGQEPVRARACWSKRRTTSRSCPSR